MLKHPSNVFIIRVNCIQLCFKCLLYCLTQCPLSDHALALAPCLCLPHTYCLAGQYHRADTRPQKASPTTHQLGKVKVLVTQLCLTLCSPMDCSPPGSAQGILQARILEWVAIPYSRGPSWHRGQTQVSCIAGGSFIVWATREATLQQPLQ